MISLALWLAAAQVVSVTAADLARNAVFMRVPIGVDSRLVLPERYLRVHGHVTTAEFLGLASGGAEPRGVLLFKPRRAGVGRLVVVGPTHVIRLDVEATPRAAALDVDLRVIEALPPAAPALIAGEARGNVPAPVTTMTPELSPPSAASGAGPVATKPVDGRTRATTSPADPPRGAPTLAAPSPRLPSEVLSPRLELRP